MLAGVTLGTLPGDMVWLDDGSLTSARKNQRGRFGESFTETVS
jgi:hypothetical protein